MSFVLFLVGASNFDQLMVKLGLRSVVNTEISQAFIFGEVYVAASEIYVENLDRNGAEMRSVNQIEVGGKVIRHYEDGAFVQQNGGSVSAGVIRQAWVSKPPFSNAKAYTFCNVTARYKYGIPVYHFGTGIVYGPIVFTDLTESERAGPLFDVAKREAQSAGVVDFSNVRKASGSGTDFLEQGLTMRWGFCDDYELPKL